MMLRSATPEPATVRLPRETVEYLSLPVTVDDVPATEFDVSIVLLDEERPTVWDAVGTDDDDNPAVLISGMDAGTYGVYVRVPDDPESPVRLFGILVIT